MEKVRRKNSRHYIDNMSIKNSFVFYALISLVIGIVIGVISITLVDDYRINLKELARRAKHEISFCEIPELELNQLGVSDEYSLEFTSFDVFGTEVRVYDEKLCEAIKKLSERRRNVVLMFYFLELPDAEIAEILDISRNSVYRNRMCSLKLIRDMYEEEL